jgi:Uncharacterized protein conserved in bacteria (DUF2188)
MSKKNIHIVPADKGWAVKREGQKQPISEHRTQESADKAGRPIARRDGVELVTHGRDGQIRDSDSFGRDPNPPKDAKH